MLNDFYCETCEKTFELDSKKKRVKCTSKACLGMAIKVAGGRPLKSSGSRNQSSGEDYDCHMHEVMTVPVAKLDEDRTLGLSLIHHVHVPKGNKN